LADKGALKIVTSAMTVAEVVKGPDEGVLPEDQAELIASYFEHDWIELIPVDRPIAEKAAALARDHSGLKPADSIHLATAIESKVIMLHTYDQRHLGKLSKKCGNPPLEIGAPKHPESLPLLDETSSHGEGGSDLKEDTSKAHHLDSDERDQRPGTEEAGAVVPAENEQPSQFDMA
jgi:predicted nucleic acid-binding protein